MIYLIIGAVCVIALLGGAKGLFKSMGLSNLAAVILFTAFMVGNLIPPIRVSDNVLLSVGGVLMMAYALFLTFYRNSWAAKVYILYVSLTLGFLFYFAGQRFVSTSAGLFDQTNWLLWGIIALSVCLLSGEPRNAFSIGVMTVAAASGAWAYFTAQPDYIVGGGGEFEAMTLVAAASMVALVVLRTVIIKAFPAKAAKEKKVKDKTKNRAIQPSPAMNVEASEEFVNTQAANPDNISDGHDM